jgi:hypothetical protein
MLKMTIPKSILILLYISIISTATCQSQTQEDAGIVDSIQRLVDEIYGPVYTVYPAIDVDGTTARESIENPYGTLTHCVLFGATGKTELVPDAPKGFFGIYNHGQIVWHSDTLVSNLFNFIGVYATGDFVRNGKVDIVTEWMEMSVWGLWIFSWDGNSGNLMNVFDERNESEIECAGDAFQFADIEGDGVLEIECVIPGEDSLAIYKWDGKLYRRWSGISREQTEQFLPKNKFSVNIHASIEDDGIGLKYKYKVQSDITSLQEINTIYIRCDTLVPFSNPTTRAKWENLSSGLRGFLIWDDLFENFIRPGEVDSSFTMMSPRLPGIRQYYIQASNRHFDLGEPTFNETAWYLDVINNSVTGFTLSPINPPKHYNQLDFVDTIKSYVTQSRALDWITDQQTSEKYLRLLTAVQSSLSHKDVDGAQKMLQSIINDVNIDHSAKLSSEAYSLIKFNTDFLLTVLFKQLK